MANERARELRRSRTAAERRLWWKLRGLRPAGFKFRQQVPIDRYIVDFACLSSRLIVEVDGGTHSTDAEVARDRRRQQYLSDQGFRILRVWNSEVRENIDGVMDTIVDALEGPPPSRPPKAEARPWRGGRVRRLQPKQGVKGGALGPPPPSPPRKGEGRSPRRGSVPRPEAKQDGQGGPLGPLPPTPPRKGEGRSVRRGRVLRPAGERLSEVGALGPQPPAPPRKGEGRSPRRGRERKDDPWLEVAYRAAAAVVDPEIPVLTLEDMGVLRGVERRDGCIVVRLTPTYSGCPATLAIQQAVERALAEAGIAGASVETVLAPPWSSDDITEEGRRKLREYGIAPPGRVSGVRPLSSARRGESRPVLERGLTPFGGLFEVESVTCPRCGSEATARVSEFGSTACKALWRCEACGEPFEAFKCL